MKIRWNLSIWMRMRITVQRKTRGITKIMRTIVIMRMMTMAGILRTKKTTGIMPMKMTAGIMKTKKTICITQMTMNTTFIMKKMICIMKWMTTRMRIMPQMPTKKTAFLRVSVIFLPA